MPFLTDKQIETLVAPETRRITLPHGKSRLHTMDRLSWDRLDDLAAIFTADQVVALADADCQRTRRPFELMFPSIIEFICSESLKRNQ